MNEWVCMWPFSLHLHHPQRVPLRGDEVGSEKFLIRFLLVRFIHVAQLHLLLSGERVCVCALGPIAHRVWYDKHQEMKSLNTSLSHIIHNILHFKQLSTKEYEGLYIYMCARAHTFCVNVPPMVWSIQNTARCINNAHNDGFLIFWSKYSGKYGNDPATNTAPDLLKEARWPERCLRAGGGRFRVRWTSRKFSLSTRSRPANTLR